MEAQVTEITGPTRDQLARVLTFEPPCNRPWHMLLIETARGGGVVCFGFNPGVLWLGRFFGRGLVCPQLLAFLFGLARARGCTLVVAKHHDRAWRFFKRSGATFVPELGEWHLEL